MSRADSRGAETANGGSKPEQIALRLRLRVTSGQYPVASFLPSERRLAEEFGVARNTVRSALDILDNEGRIDRRPGRGVLVRDQLGAGLAGVVLLITSHSPEGGALDFSPEAMALLGSALSACGGSGIRFRIQGVPENGARELADRVAGGAVSGLLLLECTDATLLDGLRTEGIPHVVINQERDLPGPATRVDFWAIGRKAADVFLSLGHRRLAVLTGPAEQHMYDRMLAGFRGCAAESEVYLRADRVVRVPTCSESSRRAALDLLGKTDRPTAIFCGRDMRAYGAYLAARELGLRVPDDLSLIGYDDITWPGEGRALLTTFPEPTREMGAAAIDMLASYIRTGEPPKDVVLCPSITLRRSTARV